MAVDHRAHRIAQPVGVERAGHGDVQLHRIHIVAGTLREAGVKQQPLLQRESAAARQRSRYCWRSSSICCWLSRAGAMSEGVSPPPPRCTCAQMPARASNHSWLSRLTWS